MASFLTFANLSNAFFETDKQSFPLSGEPAKGQTGGKGLHGLAAIPIPQ